jgi:hypothetical protein
MLPAVRESFNLVEVERRAGHEQHDAEGEDAVGRIQHWHLQGFGTEAAFGLGPALFVARDRIVKKGRLLLTSSTLWYIIPTFVWLPNRLVSGTAPKDGSLGGAGPQLLTLAATCTSSKNIRPRVASIATHACFFSDWHG